MGARNQLEELYRDEKDPDVKERLLLVLRVEGDGMVPARVASELHRSRFWTTFWLRRYRAEGAEGLRDRPREGRPPMLSDEVQVQIRNEISSRKQGWTTEQVTRLIEERGRVKYHFTHIYRLMHKWGFKEKVPQRRHANTAPIEEKEDFKKRM